MVDVVLFHHVQGLTDGVRDFAVDLRRAGHTVHAPDLVEGRTFDLPAAHERAAELVGKRVRAFLGSLQAP